MNGAAPAGWQSSESGTPIDFVAARRRFRERSAGTAVAFKAPVEAPPTSTTLPKQDRLALMRARVEAERELGQLLQLFDDQPLEDSVEVEFSRGLERVTQQYGAESVYALGEMYLSGAVGPIVLSEVLPWLGRVEDSTTHEPRFWFLAYCLRDDHPWVRSRAALGLASMKDSRAIPYLRREAATEQIRLLQARLTKVADELAS